MDSLRRKGSSVLEEDGDGYSIDGNESTLLGDNEELSLNDAASEEGVPRENSAKMWKFGARGGYSGG